MSTPFEQLAALGKLVHEPSRLAILTALAACESADFLYLQRITGLTKGNLSAHLSKLEDAGLVEIEKGYDGKVPRTTARITPTGSVTVNDHWRTLSELRASAQAWSSEDG